MAKVTLRSAAPYVLVALLAGFIAYKLRTSHFDWAGFLASFRRANFGLIALAVVVISLNYAMRAMRWAVFLRPAYKAAGGAHPGWWSLVGSQFVGFTGLAIFGRLGELIRPLLIARRTGLAFSSQIAVVTVERVFDLAAFALIFSLNLVLSPALQGLPHHELFHRVGLAIAVLTLAIAGFVAAVRLAGSFVARLLGRLFGMISHSAGKSAREKVVAFHAGLNVIDNLPDFLLAAALSVGLWLTIAMSYVLVMKAFPPPVHELTVSSCILLMGFSVVGSIVQLPGVGGGAQALTIGALTQLFSIPGEQAVSAGLMVWLVTTMSVIPFGLIYAKVEGISLRQVARRSEVAEEQLQ